jgi:tetratricopeptide (TPR) repeat protein
MSITKNEREDLINIYIQEAKKYLENKQIDFAIDRYQKALQHTTKTLPISVYIELSNLYKQEERFAEAVDIFEEARQHFPDNDEIYRLLGATYVRINAIPKAIDNYYKAIDKKNKQPVWLYASLFQLLLKEDRYQEIVKLQSTTQDIENINVASWRTIGIACAKLGKITEAISAYKKAIELDENQPAWLYTSLVQHILKQHKSIDISPEDLSIKTKFFLEEVVNYYQKAISINQNLSHRDYNQLADCLTKLGREWEAASYYIKSIQINPASFSTYIELDKIITKINDGRSKAIKESLNNIIFQPQLESKQVKKMLNQYVDSGFIGVDGNSVNPLGYYFVNQKLKIVYCSIPKNACTLFKNMIVEHSDLCMGYRQSGLNIHEFIGKNKSFLTENLLENLNSSEYFKFAVLRNPFERLVSAYLDKFAKHLDPESFCHEVISQVHQSLGIEPNIEKSITFSQFVHYVAETEDSQLNDHWRPQSNFIGFVKFDSIGQFENLDLLIDEFQDKFKIQITKEVSPHITNYQEFNDDLEFHNLYPQELRMLSGLPKAKQLYTPELKQIVRERYSRDVELYEKTFQVII